MRSGAVLPPPLVREHRADYDAAGEAARAVDGPDASLPHAEHAVATLTTQPLDGTVDDDALLDSIACLRRLQSAVEAEALRRLGELDRRKAHVGRARSTEELAAETLNATRGHARHQVRTAAALRQLPHTLQAYAAGRLDAAKIRHARCLVEEIDDARRRGQPIADDALEQLDAQLAHKAPETPLAELRRDLDRWTRRAVPELLADRERNAHARRFLHTTQGPDGLRITGLLDMRAGMMLLTALASLSGKHGPDDDRTYEQRQADAVGALAEGHLDAGDLPEIARQRPHLLLVADQRALEGDPDAPAPLLDGHGPVSTQMARQISDDAVATLALNDDEGAPNAVGRTQRYPNRALRVKVTVRDEGCVGCRAPINRCQFHHIVPWHQSGPTELENLCLLCPACHHKLHHYKWRIVDGEERRFQLAPPKKGRGEPGEARGEPGDGRGERGDDASEPGGDAMRRRTP